MAVVTLYPPPFMLSLLFSDPPPLSPSLSLFLSSKCFKMLCPVCKVTGPFMKMKIQVRPSPPQHVHHYYTTSSPLNKGIAIIRHDQYMSPPYDTTVCHRVRAPVHSISHNTPTTKPRCHRTTLPPQYIIITIPRRRHYTKTLHYHNTHNMSLPIYVTIVRHHNTPQSSYPRSLRSLLPSPPPPFGSRATAYTRSFRRVFSTPVGVLPGLKFKYI
jgi:hypothetical protein